MEIYQLSGYNSIVRVRVNAHCTVCETAVHIHKFLMQRGLIRHAHYINVTVEVLFTSQMFCGVSSCGLSSRISASSTQLSTLEMFVYRQFIFIFSQISTYICGPYQILTILFKLQRFVVSQISKPRC